MVGPEPRRRPLDPVSRATEILFGLIMVLTFTASLNATGAGRAEVPLMLVGVLACNLVWGLIDAVMYLISTKGEPALAANVAASVRSAESAMRARAAIAGALPPMVASALPDQDFERIRSHVVALPGPAKSRLEAGDYAAAFSVFLLGFLCALPGALPFVFIDDARIVLPFSHAIAIALLFLAGWSLGRNWGRPWQVGVSMVGLGVVLVAIALALGG